MSAKERPIIFSAPMVRAILEGRKTMTRRVVKPRKSAEGLVIDPHQSADYASEQLESLEIQGFSFREEPDGLYRVMPPCPYGKPGDRLWVRETFAVVQKMDDNQMFVIDDNGDYIDEVWYRADGKEYCYLPSDSDEFRDSPPWKPSIHMPRWASRILLEVTEVRVERLNDISEADAVAEGCKADVRRWWQYFEYVDSPRGRHRSMREGGDPDKPPRPDWLYPEVQEYRIPAKEKFSDLWQSINGPDSWDANPLVWVVSFRRIES